jgi:hypothetical protein
MIWELYEVWAEFDGRNELIDTTKSLKEARQMAKKAINEGAEAAAVYRESEDGEYEVVEEM